MGKWLFLALLAVSAVGCNLILGNQEHEQAADSSVEPNATVSDAGGDHETRDAPEADADAMAVADAGDAESEASEPSETGPSVVAGCDAGQDAGIFEGGTCGCATGFSSCSTGCVNESTDPNNCGGCGKTCASGQHCSGGSCVCDSTSCAGCCTASAQCESSSNATCGTGGVSCVACPSTAPCTSGICLGCSAATAIPESDADFSTTSANDQFGSSLAIGGDTLIVGAPGVDSTGTAWSFTGSGTTWTFQGFATPPGSITGTNYGFQAAASASWALLYGFPTGGTQTAYVFSIESSGLFLETSLVPPNPSEVTGSIAVDGNTVVLGGSTAAYVYTGSGSTWTLQATLEPSDFTPSVANDLFFGSPVSISGSTILVGAEPLDSNGQTAHWAYIFVGSGASWTEQAKLVPAGLADNGGPHFNFTIATNGTSAGLACNGGVYVFTQSGTTWPQTQFVAPTSVVGNFGSALAMSGNLMVAGSENPVGGVGAAYVLGLASGTWIVGPELSTGVTADNYGTSVAASGNSVAVGAPFAPDAVGPGVVYTYSCFP